MARGRFANPSHETARERGRRTNKDRFANGDAPKSPTIIYLLYSKLFQVLMVVHLFLMVVNLFGTRSFLKKVKTRLKTVINSLFKKGFHCKRF